MSYFTGSLLAKDQYHKCLKSIQCKVVYNGEQHVYTDEEAI
jgi:hypothetical protein